MSRSKNDRGQGIVLLVTMLEHGMLAGFRALGGDLRTMHSLRHKRQTTRQQRRETGQVLVTAALAMVIIMGFAGLGIDLGVLRATRRRMRTAADSAAMAAAEELNYGNYVSAADADAAVNGFTNGSNGVTIAVNSPPTAGAFVGQTGYAEVIINQPQPTYFMRILGVNSAAVGARAVAHLGNDSNCIYALNSSKQDAIRLNGSNTITASCGMQVNSNDPRALYNNGSSVVQAGSIGVTGNYVNKGSLTPPPVTGVKPAPDPLASTPQPSVGACTFPSQVKISDSGNHTLNPGVYCGGIAITGSGNVTLSAGMYIINGGGLGFGGTADVHGTGITFYVTGGARVNISGGNNCSLIAPTDGTYAGILFFQDPADTADATINGTTLTVITGALYFPSAQLTYSGSGVLDAYTILVADTILFDGNTTLNNNYSSLGGGSPIKDAKLAE